MKQPTRRQRGIAQNFANQLAQIAVGWQIVIDSASLSHADRGVIQFDVLRASATIDKKPAELHMARYLHEWTAGELNRQGLAESWLTQAGVSLHYSRFRGVESRDSADLTATANIVSGYGKASATRNNDQPLFMKRFRPRLLSRLRRIFRFGP